MNTVSDDIVLPELGDDRVAAIEERVFARIGDEDAPAVAALGSARDRSRRRRTRVWWGAGAAAAIIVVAAIAAPAIVRSITPTAGSDAMVPDMVAPAGSAPELFPYEESAGGRDSDLSMADGSAVAGSGVAESAAGTAVEPGTGADREIIANGSVALAVDDVHVAAREVAALTGDLGGYVEQLTVDGAGPDDVRMNSGTMPYEPYQRSGGWVQVRIPADQLDAAMERLGELGTVESSTVSRQDVTDQAVDLRAQVAAAEASVARLTELMSQAETVGDLLAAESALAERQATLESYRQQLEWLDGQVAMSALSVSLTPRVEAVAADPAGFGDGFAAGWYGLIAALNALVIALGFLLPWLAVAAAAALLVWGLIRLFRRSRRPRAAVPGSAGPGSVGAGSADSGSADSGAPEER